MATDADAPAAVATACLALILSAACAAFMLGSSATTLALGRGEDVEWLIYASAFGIVLPLATLAGLRVMHALRERGVLYVGAAAWAVATLCLVGFARAAFALDQNAGTDSLPVVAAELIWLGVTVAGAAVLLRDPGRAVRFDRAGLLTIPGCLLLVVVLALSRGLGLGISEIVTAVALAASAVVVHLVVLRNRCPRGVAIALDAAVVLLLLMLISDFALHEEPERFFATFSDLHQNFYLGPLNDVLNGRPVLVESFSQYGVGIFYALAALFEVATPGYAGLTLISGLSTALMLATAYAILRYARTPRSVTLAAIAVATIAAHFHPLQPSTTYPSGGGFRFLLPYLLVLAAMVAVHSPPRGPGRLGPLIVLGLASLWSVETFVYSAAAMGGIVAHHVLAQATDARSALASAARQIAACALAVIGFQVAFALALRLLAGDWPDWGHYLAFFSSYSVDGLGSVGMFPWSASLVIGAVYVATVAGLVVLRVHAPRFFVEEPAVLTAAAGLALFGGASLSYFVGRSIIGVPEILSPPAIVVGGLWLGLLERRRATAHGGMRIGALVAAGLAVGMLVTYATPELKERGRDSALAVAFLGTEGGTSFSDAASRMWNSEPLDDRVAGGRMLLERYFPGDGPALVMAESDHTTEILVAASRVNLLPVSHFLEDGILPERSFPAIADAVDRLPAGSLMLTERGTLNPQRTAVTELEPLTRAADMLLRRTVTRIRDRFELHVVDRAAGGFLVVELRSRG